MRNALRNLAKAPGFTVIAVITLALGIGLNTSMFSLMNLLLLQPLPYPDAERLVRINHTTPKGQSPAHTTPDILELLPALKGAQSVATYRMWGFNLARADRPPVNLNALRVSASFFPTLGLQPELGRYFGAEDDHPGNHVIVLSHATWQAQFGGDRNVIGTTVRIDGEPTTIVGVTPASFRSPFLWGPADAFRPMAMLDYERVDTKNETTSVIARIAPGVSVEQFNQQLKVLSQQLAEHRPPARRADGLFALPLQQIAQGPSTRAMSWTMLGLAASVLMIACANLANLQLARTIARAQEFAIRSALGASRLRMLQPTVTESLIVSLAGGALGILVALWANDWMSSELSAQGDVMFRLVLDWKVLTFALAVSTVTGIGFGLVPSLVLTHLRVNDVLKSGARGNTGGPAHNRVRHALIVGQFALALILLATATQFIRGFDRMLRRDVGWDHRDLLSGTINLPQAKYDNAEKITAFHDRLEQRLRTLPGVENAAEGWSLPIFMYLTTRSYVVDGHEPPPAGREPSAYVNSVTPAFLPTLKIQLLAGRNFTPADNLRAAHVAIINQAMAHALFGDQSPIGHRIGGTDPANRDWLEIVGVMPDVRFAVNFATPQTQFVVYKPLAQEPWGYSSFVLRAPNAAQLTDQVRRAVAEIDPDLPIQQLNTVDETVRLTSRSFHMVSSLLSAFAGLGIFLAALGLYGVTTRLVTQRTPEIGVRVALGAQSTDIVWLIMRAGLKLTLIGTAIGFAGAYGMSVLFESATPMPMHDPMLIVLVSALLLVVALIACWIPSMRASRVDPLVALRAE